MVVFSAGFDSFGRMERDEKSALTIAKPDVAHGGLSHTVAHFRPRFYERYELTESRCPNPRRLGLSESR